MAPIPKSVVRAQPQAPSLPKWVFNDFKLASEAPPEYFGLERERKNHDGTVADYGPLEAERFSLFYKDGSQIDVAKKYNGSTQYRSVEIRPKKRDFDGDGVADAMLFEFDVDKQWRKNSLSAALVHSSLEQTWYGLDKSVNKTPTETNFGLNTPGADNQSANMGAPFSVKDLIRRYKHDDKTDEALTIPTSIEYLKEVKSSK